jgi:glycogen operon protein
VTRSSISPPSAGAIPSRRKVRPGRPWPLGATWDGAGVNFAIFSENATAIDVCLFDSPGGPETDRIRLPETTAHVFHGHVPGLSPGQLYGFRVHGAYAPDHGHRFNAAKLLVDPYARALAGELRHEEPVYGWVRKQQREDLLADERDSAPLVPKGVVVDDSFPWGRDQHPATPWPDTVIYEMHVKGFTQRHPDIDPAIRGTYAALASAPAIEHLKRLGVTAIELMPVHQAAKEGFLAERGLENYWGYSTLGFFAPDARFSSSGDRGGQVHEFKAMVKALHAEGIEVILDVVYNHTCEGNHLGPTLSLRGIDNASYYRLHPGNRRYYVDYTGTGNSLNMLHPQTLKLIMDSLRYWVTEMHVDGFRFDLASTLARELHDVDRLSAFFDIIHQDPILSTTKLIAEPWDVGEGGYQVGNFPVLWTEWNGRYRDSIRRFWGGMDRHVKELGFRLTGSSDLYQDDGRRPYASINFVTSHDGFTLHDLVTYEKKHNEANGENNRDGDDNNNAWNGGVEGESDDPAIVALRARQVRNVIATILLSQGVPMLVSGDELGRTQRGNNNAYCQDNALSWVDWSLDEPRKQLLAFVRAMVAFRKEHAVLRRRRFFQGVHVRGSGHKDLAWFRADGSEMTGADWDGPKRTIGFLLGGDAIPAVDDQGEPIVDDTLLVLMNGERTPTRFQLPAVEWGARWELLFDTRAAEQPIMRGGAPIEPAATVLDLEGLSVAVLRKLEAET